MRKRDTVRYKNEWLETSTWYHPAKPSNTVVSFILSKDLFFTESAGNCILVVFYDEKNDFFYKILMFKFHFKLILKNVPKLKRRNWETNSN